MKTIAFTREISDSIERCELTHLDRLPIDLPRARAQHVAFENALRELGCEVRRIPDAHNLPDAVFVQDAVLVFDELAVLARPGAVSRRPEVESVGVEIGRLRPIARIVAPGTLDGGDVLVLGRNVFVGQTPRTNRVGVEQLAALLKPHCYTVTPVPVIGCLHLQTAVTAVAEDVILANRDWVDPTIFGKVEILDVAPGEPFAANVLRVGNSIVFPNIFPLTQAVLESRGLRVVPVDLSELAKAEAGVTCCCVLVPPLSAASACHKTLQSDPPFQGNPL